jgi:hypothetical protein
MEIPKLNQNLFKSESTTPTKHCIELIKQADHLLKRINDEKSKKVKGKEESSMSPQFLKAVKNLSSRLKTYKKIDGSLITRPVPTVVEKIGPGSYNVVRSFTPIISPANLLLEKMSKFKQA